jgi:hypothetical protein
VSNLLTWINAQTFNSKAAVSNESGNKAPINVKENGLAEAAAASNSNDKNELDNKEFTVQVQVM